MTTSWGVLIKMYPDADILMVQLSIDSTKPAARHMEMGRKLATLRDEGIMLVASGNVVHNLRTARWHGEIRLTHGQRPLTITLKTI